MDKNKIYLYCDGGCRGNQFDENKGGWGYILLYDNGKLNKKEDFGSQINTTNNIMELSSCINGLKSIQNKDIPVEIVMDSQYVITGMNEWIKGWIKNNWKTAKKQPVANQDLWQELYGLSQQFGNIIFSKCKGHSDDEYNNYADILANKGMDLI